MVFMEDLDLKLVQSAVDELDRDLQAIGFKEFDSGRARTVVDVDLNQGDNLVLYICHKESVEERFRKEEKLLERVNDDTEIPTPNIIYSDLSKQKIPYLFYIGEKIEGYDPVDRYKYLAKEERFEILKQSARYLGELHRNVDFQDYGKIKYRGKNLEIDRCSWYKWMERWAEPHIESLADSRFSDLQEDARRFMREHRHLAEVSNPCCVHFDVTPDNLIVEDGAIKAVLDWEKSISGAPEWDLQYSKILMIDAQFETGSIEQEMFKEFLNAYLQENELKTGWQKRFLYYNTIWTYQALANFEKQEDKQDKLEQEKFFRNLVERRFESLDDALQEEFPEEFL
jgi:aminoglycoside phosphotransferase (APT) family kinase protein